MSIVPAGRYRANAILPLAPGKAAWAGVARARAERQAPTSAALRLAVSLLPPFDHDRTYRVRATRAIAPARASARPALGFAPTAFGFNSPGGIRRRASTCGVRRTP